MKNRSLVLASILLAFGASPGFAIDYCDLLAQPSAVGFNPPSQTAQEILKTLSNAAPFNYSSIQLRDSRDTMLKAQGAAAQICYQNQRWIFYDPDFIEKIRTAGQSNWPKYFIFAHEVAHHFNNDPQDHHPDQELQADRAAARWLTSIGASVYDLTESINAFVVNENSVKDYPSRCDRVIGVIHAYNESAGMMNRQGASKPLYEVGDCMPVAGGGGVYAAKNIGAGSVIQAVDLVRYGTPAANANVPLDYDRDLAGMCTVTAFHKGDRLTWDNVGVCALMHRS